MLRGRKHYRTIEKWGLLYPADPNLNALEANVFWHPDWLAGTLDVRLAPVTGTDEVPDDPHDTIVLAALKSRRLLYEGLDGTRHILLNGSRFWVQLKSRATAPVGERATVSIQIEGATHGMRRIDTMRQLFALHRSAGGKLSLIGRRRNAKPLQNALAAHDIIHGFERPKGDLKDIAEMINGPARIAADWNKDNRALKQQARRAIARAEDLIERSYRDLLTKKTL